MRLMLSHPTDHLGVDSTSLIMEAIVGGDTPDRASPGVRTVSTDGGGLVNTPVTLNFISRTYCTCPRDSAPAYPGHGGDPMCHDCGNTPTCHGRGSTPVSQVGHSGSSQGSSRHGGPVINAEDSSDNSSSCKLWNLSPPSFIH